MSTRANEIQAPEGSCDRPRIAVARAASPRDVGADGGCPGSGRRSGPGASWGAVLFWGSVALVLVWCFPYHQWLQHANELPRAFLTMAVVEEGSFAIDTPRQRFGYAKAMDISRSVCLGPRIVGSLRMRALDGSGRPVVHVPRFEDPRRPPCRERFFSNKAPGQSFVAVPVYAALRALWRAEGRGAGPGAADRAAARDPVVRADRLREAIRWARLGTATVPAFLFLLLLAWWLRPWVPDPHVRRVAVTAYGLGTLAFTYSVQLMSHQLAAALAFTGFVLVGSVARGRVGRSGPRAVLWLGLAGLAAGSAFLCDYQLALALAALSVYALVVVRPIARILWVGLGALPPLALLLYYHHAAFGAVDWTGYEFLVATGDQALHARGFLGMTRPTLEALWGSFFRPDNGLVYFSPWLLVALLGAGALWRLPGPGAIARPAGAPAPRAPSPGWPSPEAGFSLLLVALYVYFIGSIAFWRGGWQTGPRYVAAMLPCFVLPYALLLHRVRDRPLAWAAAVAPALFAVGVHALVVTGFPHFPEKFKYPLFDLVAPLLADGYVSYTLGGAIYGHSRDAALFPYIALLFILGGYLAVGPVRLLGPGASRCGARLVAGVLAFWLAALAARGYQILAERGIARARPHPVVGTSGERYGAFLKRAHRDIRRSWEPGSLGPPLDPRSPGGLSR